jgi:hypothetical protein
MEKVRAYVPVMQFFNDDGSPMVGGHLNTYKAGTSIPVTTYADASGTRNPASIPLDSRGECVVYLESGKLYKFVLSDKDGVVKWTADNYSVNGGGSGGGGISPAVLIATAEIIEGNDNALSQSFSFFESKKLGDDIYIQEGSVKCDAGVYHVDFTISIAINQTTPPRPWVENVSIDYGVGYAYINLDRSNMDPTASDSVDVGYDIVVDTDGTTLPVTLIGLGTNCYATMQHFNVHKVAEAE